MKEIVFDKDMAYTPEGIIEAVANSEGIGQQEIGRVPKSSPISGHFSQSE